MITTIPRWLVPCENRRPCDDGLCVSVSCRRRAPVLQHLRAYAEPWIAVVDRIVRIAIYVGNKMRNRTLIIGGGILMMSLTPDFATAQHDWHGSEQQAKWASSADGDLSMHPSWKVYRHELADVIYIQVVDNGGMQQLAVGVSKDWGAVHLVENDSMAVSIPSSPLSIPAEAIAELVYAEDSFSLLLHTDGVTSTWSIEPVSKQRE